MRTTTVECMCDEACENEFEVPDKLFLEVEAFGDKFIAIKCPNTDIEKETIVRKFKDFVQIETIHEPVWNGP